ncbi:LamG-like jellyroll fold domain-containing protein [uncultured Prevotella sp.]|uniref:endo-beta-N-acetylglucosaminidase n=1 Tax=uncultured Prevotella sp. TaxID=159272 RepID=UPI002591E1BC|nr:LamG-like jellyroll fold domain-containing protein [uncultured Prevotella sp.]
MKNTITTIAVAIISCMTATAQRTPKHEFDFEKVTVGGEKKEINWKDLYRFFDSWQPGTPPCGLSRIDDEFFISRQRPLKRITDGDYQVRSDVEAERRMFLWTPLDDPTTKWKALPRYCFEGDNFSMWQYIDTHGNWSAPWLRVSAGISDAAAKNGVTVGCVLSVPWDAEVGDTVKADYSQTLMKLAERNADGSFRNSLKLARLMKYYGINALGVNSEFNTDKATMMRLQDFFIDVHRKAKDIGWTFELQWYDVTDDNGELSLDCGLGEQNKRMFGTKDSIATDRLFANYNWTDDILKASAKYARSLGRSSYDYYAGFDIQGRAWNNKHWQDLVNNDISVGVWGAHSQNLLHQSATDDGTADVIIQKAYLLKQELSFSGGYRNPALLPEVRTDCSLSNADLRTFHGLARLLTAKSTIQQVPFVTRFNLGNGLHYYKDGKVAFDSKWYNLNTQDYLPTWRFWITDEDDQTTAENIGSFVNAELSWDDSYTGGSCLQLHGATKFSRIKLFKTKLLTQPSYELSLTYKMPKGRDTHARLFVALKGNTSVYKEIALPAAKRENTWTTFKTPLKKLGLKAGDEVAMMGIVVEGTGDDYVMNIGEMAIRNPRQRFNTVKPWIKEIEVMRGWNNSVDFKMRYASKEEKGDEKTYNDEVGTWYYEIYFQQKGRPQQLLTATESWAAYVIGAPLAEGYKRECRFGVRAVSPDGQQGSDIAWSDYRVIEYNALNSTPAIDRDRIKPGEAFTIYYKDNMMPPAKEWRIIDALTDKVIAKAENSTSISTSIDKEGIYDLMTINGDGSQTMTRGLVKVSPLSSTSKALKLNDPYMLTIPAEALPGLEYSVALWVKADDWTHDKQGTNIVSKNSIADKWPFNNWGDLWVQVCPPWTDEKSGKEHPANEIMYRTMGCGGDIEGHGDMTTDGYSIPAGVWTHIMVTQDKEKVQRVYINGRLVAGPLQMPESTRRELMPADNKKIDHNAVADIRIGGSGVYKAGLNGAIDNVQIWNRALTAEEVLRCMRGFTDKEVPEGLSAYFTFEETDVDGVFPNHGKTPGCKARIMRMADSGGEYTGKAKYVDRNGETHIKSQVSTSDRPL